MLQNIIPSKARRKILGLFFQNPTENSYLRKIVRDVDEEVNAVKRELDILAASKILIREQRMNKIFYSLSKNYIFYDEFLRIFTKNGNLANQIYKSLPKLGKVRFIALSTKYAKRTAIKPEEIYLLLVGTIVVPEVASIMTTEEKNFGKEINYTVMNEEEFNFRKKNNDPFIWRFLKQPKIMLVGSEEELLK